MLVITSMVSALQCVAIPARIVSPAGCAQVARQVSLDLMMVAKLYGDDHALTTPGRIRRVSLSLRVSLGFSTVSG